MLTVEWSDFEGFLGRAKGCEIYPALTRQSRDLFFFPKLLPLHRFLSFKIQYKYLIDNWGEGALPFHCPETTT